MCDVRDQMLDGFLEGINDSALVCSGIKGTMDGWMSTEQSLTNTDKITTYNFLEETYYTNRLLIFFINEITKISGTTRTKNLQKFDNGEVNNACSVALPNEMEQKSIIQTLFSALKNRFGSQWWHHNSTCKAYSTIYEHIQSNDIALIMLNAIKEYTYKCWLIFHFKFIIILSGKCVAEK